MMAKFSDWVESWKSQYKEEINCEVLKADISMVLKKDNGEIIVRKSEYRSNNLPEIKLANKLPRNGVICG
jgi:hypothetical protein